MHGGTILDDALREGSQETGRGIGDLVVQIGTRVAFDHAVEPVHEIAGDDERRMVPSMIANVRVTVLDSRPRSVVIMRSDRTRGRVLARRAAPVAVRSSRCAAASPIRRSREAHRQSLPAWPAATTRHRSGSQLPSPHQAVSGMGPAKSNLLRKMSLRGRHAPLGVPSPRDLPVSRTISFSAPRPASPARGWQCSSSSPA